MPKGSKIFILGVSKTKNYVLNMPSQNVWKFIPVFYRISALGGRCPALTPLLQAGYWVPLTMGNPWITCQPRLTLQK